MNILNAKVLEVLKCPCCSFYMKGPVYVCLSGHSLCESCQKEKVCSICCLACSRNRNFALESIARLILFPCKNEDVGCPIYLKTDELNEHYLSCDYRDYECRLDECCLWKGPRESLRKHYFDEHSNNILIGSDCVCIWKRDKTEYHTYFMLAFDEMFYVHAKLKDDIFYWAIQYIGRSEDVILYCFDLQIFTDQFNDRKLEFSEICHDDIKTDIDEIIDSGFCVAVPMAVLNTYLNSEEVLFYRIEMKKA